MSDSNKMVAAIYAAAAAAKEPSMALDEFLVNYEGCLKELEDRAAATKAKAAERALDSWTKLGN